MTCAPMVWTGLRLAIGSWKIMTISRPRMLRIRCPLGLSAARSIGFPGACPGELSCSSTCPPTIRPGFGTMLRIERAVTLLPLPLSPTTQSVLPRRIVMLTWSTALTVSCRVSNQVLRSFTSSTISFDGSAMVTLLAIGIGGIAQAVADKVEGKDRDDHGDSGCEQPGGGGDGANVLRLLKEDAPADHRRLKAESEKAQCR